MCPAQLSSIRVQCHLLREQMPFTPPCAEYVTGAQLQGVGNLAPYSYFGVMSHDPPYVTIGTTVGKRPNHMKDSQQNILETK